MIDQQGRKIKYLRLSVTDRCNLRCQYCMPAEGIQKSAHDAIMSYESYLKIVETMAGLGIDSVRLTGGEPLVRKNLESLVLGIKQIKGIKDLSMTTNGILLAEQLEDLVHAGLDRVNISLDSLNPKTYRTITRGGDLQEVLRGIERCKHLKLYPIKINVVLIQGVNTHEIDDFIQMAEPGLEVRFIELMPIGEAAEWSRDRFVSVEELISRRQDLRPYTPTAHNGPSRLFEKKSNGGLIGIIHPISNHFCQACNRLRVTSDGKLKLCLHSDEEVDLKPFMEDSETLKQVILEAVSVKPIRHHLETEEGFIKKRNMNAIGG